MGRYAQEKVICGLWDVLRLGLAWIYNKNQPSVSDV